MVAVPAEVRRLADAGRPAAMSGLGSLAGLAGPGGLAGLSGLAGEGVLPVVEPLETLLAWGGLRRGAPVEVSGAAALSLALLLAAGPSANGSWVGVLGLDGIGLVAAAELGVHLDRLLVVGRPPRQSWAAVADALVGAVDVLLLGKGAWAGTGQVRRLATRARDAGTVLVAVAGEGGLAREGEALGPELRLDARPASWSGIHRGHGHLAAREVVVEARGRRGADRPRRASLLLAGEGDRVEVRLAPPETGGIDHPATRSSAHLRLLREEVAG